MKHNLPFKFFMISALAFFSLEMTAQRYLTEIFTDAQITVTSDVTYGTNIRFLPPVDFTTTQSQQDVVALQTIAATTGEFPGAYYDPSDASTTVKIQDLQMDVYAPSSDADDMTDRPVVVYLHTGNFLPPPINGSPVGLRTDSTAIVNCRKLAKRGFVAIAVSYRLGWNPLAPTTEGRRGTLLNAVYRAIQDTKQSVRFIRENADGPNSYGINPNQIVLMGEGSGGYVALAYATLDNLDEELNIEKFINPETDQSYVTPAIVGDEEGLNGALTLYQDNGQNTDIQMTINLGGALGDISWLEAGDAPMVAFHAIRDDFAPFDEGTVIVPTNQNTVVDVSGSNVFIQAANDLGNNDAFANMPDGNAYTDQARSLYGTGPYEISNGGSVTISSDPEGLYPIVLPLTGFLTNVASPWQWWNPNSPIAQAEVAPGITAHMASLSSNPNMSPTQGRTYLDTIHGYAVPRIMCVLGLDGVDCGTVSTNNTIQDNSTIIFPNPTRDALTIRNNDFVIREVRMYDITGRMVGGNIVNANEYRMERGNLNNGVYMMQITFDNQTITRKVLFN